MSARPDVTLLLEGTYPYVAGGVSTWVHQILNSYPERKFSLLHISPAEGAYEKQVFQMPANVVSMQEVHCRGNEPVGRRGQLRAKPVAPRKTPSRTLGAIARLHLADTVDEQLIADLAANDLSIAELLHGEETFELIRRELYPRLGSEAPFIDFFWHFRAMHIPMLRLLSAGCPEADVYHAVSTGYAGLVGAVESYKTGRPLLVTEHGLYAREREMELSRATWIKDVGSGRATGASKPSPLRRFWSHWFRMLSRIAYHQAARLITLSEANRAKQLVDGADPKKIEVVPNGVKFSEPQKPAGTTPTPESHPKVPGRMRVGFVGRVVPIKDVITLIRAVGIAREQVDLEVWIIGPQDEDAAYAARCRALCASLGLESVIQFLGPQPVSQLYPQLDVVLLTSLSEGQPLVILEAYIAGVPVIATDVGACRELCEGGDTDRRLGPSGICTRVANPAGTAAALVKMAKYPELRAAMGRAGAARVAARYQLQQVVARYDNLYTSMVP